jgi:hypothetical protein
MKPSPANPSLCWNSGVSTRIWGGGAASNDWQPLRWRISQTINYNYKSARSFGSNGVEKWPSDPAINEMCGWWDVSISSHGTESPFWGCSRFWYKDSLRTEEMGTSNTAKHLHLLAYLPSHQLSQFNSIKTLSSCLLHHLFLDTQLRARRNSLSFISQAYHTRLSMAMR